MSQQDPYARPQDPYAGPGYATQRRSGGGLFPFPHRSWRTNRGTQVTVGGCCLPLPLGCLTTLAVAGAAAYVAHRGR